MALPDWHFVLNVAARCLANGYSVRPSVSVRVTFQSKMKTCIGQMGKISRAILGDIDSGFGWAVTSLKQLSPLNVTLFVETLFSSKDQIEQKIIPCRSFIAVQTLWRCTLRRGTESMNCVGPEIVGRLAGASEEAIRGMEAAEV
jgi:hypothetical protein